MVTPFDDDLALDVDGAVELAKWLQSRATKASSSAGTTGESPTLSDDEKLQLWEAVAGAVTIPVVAGSTGNDTAHDVHLTVEASKLGVAGILALCPYYSRPSQAGIEAHLRAIAASTDLPVVIYDIPIRTGRKIATDVLVRLANEVPNILGVKDAAGNPGETARLVAAAPESSRCTAATTSMTLPLVAVGAVGVDRRRRRTGSPPTSSSSSTPGSAATPPAARRVNARLLESYRVRDRRRGAEPDAVEGDAAPPRPARRSLPAAARTRPGLVGASGRPRCTAGWSPPVADPAARRRRTRRPGATPSASSSSAVSARSAATAWRSSWAAVRRATGPTGRSCSSTAG